MAEQRRGLRPGDQPREEAGTWRGGCQGCRVRVRERGDPDTDQLEWDADLGPQGSFSEASGEKVGCRGEVRKSPCRSQLGVSSRGHCSVCVWVFLDV